MAQFNLDPLELAIVVSWLFEPSGYLDISVRVSDGQTARQALADDSNLDLVQWVRDNPQTDPDSSGEAAMAWWIWKNTGVSFDDLPAEISSWVETLREWGDSISEAFSRVSVAERNTGAEVELCNEFRFAENSVFSGDYLVVQQSMISKVAQALFV